MALTDKELDEVEQNLRKAFNLASGHLKDCQPWTSTDYVLKTTTAVGTTAQALLSLENERRLREERQPFKMIKK